MRRNEAGRPATDQDLANLQKAVRPERPNQRHGAWAFLAGRDLPPESEWALEMANAIREEILSEEALTDAGPGEGAKRRLVIDSITRVQTVALLLFKDIVERGLSWTTKGGKEVKNGSLAALCSYENTLRLGLLTLGLEARAREVPNLSQYVKEFDAKAKKMKLED